jgi:hypothetical protein
MVSDHSPITPTADAEVNNESQILPTGGNGGTGTAVFETLTGNLVRIARMRVSRRQTTDFY